MLQTNTKEHYLMVHRTKYEGALKEGSILKVDITKEMLFNMKQSLRFVKQPQQKTRSFKLLRKNVEKKEN